MKRVSRAALMGWLAGWVVAWMVAPCVVAAGIVPTPQARSFTVVRDSAEEVVFGFAEPLPGRSERLGVYVRCERPGGRLTAGMFSGRSRQASRCRRQCVRVRHRWSGSDRWWWAVRSRDFTNHRLWSGRMCCASWRWRSPKGRSSVTVTTRCGTAFRLRRAAGRVRRLSGVRVDERCGVVGSRVVQ